MRIRSWEWTSEAPVTVSSSPRPWWSTSSTWENGSSRAPNRDLVLRTPLATAPDASPVLRVDVQDAVGLAEPE